jgi:hypothetical protein
MVVFREAGVPEGDLLNYRRQRLFDAVFFDKLFDSFTKEQRKEIAYRVVEIIEGGHTLLQAGTGLTGKRKFKSARSK